MSQFHFDKVGYAYRVFWQIRLKRGKMKGERTEGDGQMVGWLCLCLGAVMQGHLGFHCGRGPDCVQYCIVWACLCELELVDIGGLPVHWACVIRR